MFLTFVDMSTYNVGEVYSVLSVYRDAKIKKGIYSLPVRILGTVEIWAGEWGF